MLAWQTWFLTVERVLLPLACLTKWQQSWEVVCALSPHRADEEEGMTSCWGMTTTFCCTETIHLDLFCFQAETCRSAKCTEVSISLCIWKYNTYVMLTSIFFHMLECISVPYVLNCCTIWNKMGKECLLSFFGAIVSVAKVRQTERYDFTLPPFPGDKNWPKWIKLGSLRHSHIMFYAR